MKNYWKAFLEGKADHVYTLGGVEHGLFLLPGRKTLVIWEDARGVKFFTWRKGHVKIRITKRNEWIEEEVE